jgi:Virulence factor
VITTYKILYWQEVPSQIKAEDERDEVTLSLDPRFMERIDQLATQRGLLRTDDYLAQWQWSEEQQREGTAEEVAQAIKAQLESEIDW